MGLFDIFKKKPYKEEPEEIEAVPVRKSIEEFFSIDIHNLKAYTEAGVDMGNHKLSAIALNNDMGLFTHAIIREFVDGSYNVEFKSDKNFMTTELSEFISVCVSIFGPTKAGETYLTDRDFLFIQRGCFSRLWDKIYIDMMTNENGVKTMNITIFSPKQYNYE